MSETPISPLRRRMIEDMSLRKFGEKTQHDYIGYVKTFSTFLGRSPATATPEDLRRYQVQQSQSGLSPATINSSVSALRFFFRVTLNHPEMGRHLTLVPLPEAAGRAQPGGGSAAHRGSPWRQVQGRVRCGLWCRPACVGGRPPDGLGHRQATHAATHRAGQGQEGPPRDALTTFIGDPERLLVGGEAEHVVVPRASGF